MSVPFSVVPLLPPKVVEKCTPSGVESIKNIRRRIGKDDSGIDRVHPRVVGGVPFSVAALPKCIPSLT